jgi:predicted ATPase
MLGKPRLEPSGFSRPKALAFLAYLLLEGKQSRQTMSELFWGHDPQHADNSLRNQLFQYKNRATIWLEQHLIGFEADSDLLQLQHHFDQGNDLAAVQLYQGEFLAGFSPSKDSQLHQWLLTTRQFIKRQVLEAHLRLWRSQADQNLLERAHAVLLETDTELSTWFLAQLEQPSPTTRHNLPSSPSPFFGRSQEQHLILERLHNPDADAQMLSLVGLGGIGKTRLALEVGRAALSSQRFLGGVFFVPLETVQHANEMLWRIAVALEFNLAAQPSLLEQLGQAIVQPTLFILDNLEQVVDAAETLNELLEAVPHLGLLCTSREVLGLHAEHVYLLSGLEPVAAQALLLARAPQAQTDLGAVTALCQLLQGIPLALELAAGQLAAQSPQDLLARLRQSVESLVANSPDLPERQRSLRAVFGHSWALLSAPKRQALERMALFRGGARRSSLFGVADVSLSVLAHLIDASLVQRTGQRYGIHPLILEFVAEILSKKPEYPSLRQRHAEHYLENTAQSLQKIRSPEATQVMQQLEAELDNLDLAWAWALEQGEPNSVVSLEEMVVFFDRKALWQRGIEFFTRALAVKPEDDTAQAVLHIGVAWLNYRLEKFDAAIETAERVLQLEAVQDIHKSKALNTLASIHSHLEQNKEAISTYLQILELPSTPERRVTILCNLARIYFDDRQTEKANTTLTEAKALLEKNTSLELQIVVYLCEANFFAKENQEVPEVFVRKLVEIYHQSKKDFVYSQVYFELYLAIFALRAKDENTFLFFINLFFLHSNERRLPSLIAWAYIQVGLFLEQSNPKNALTFLASALLTAHAAKQNALFIQAALWFVKLYQGVLPDYVLDGLSSQVGITTWESDILKFARLKSKSVAPIRIGDDLLEAKNWLLHTAKSLGSPIETRAIPNIFWTHQ